MINEIRAARLAAGLTQMEAAELVGVPYRTFEHWDRGTRRPPEWAKKTVLEKLQRA